MEHFVPEEGEHSICESGPYRDDQKGERLNFIVHTPPVYHWYYAKFCSQCYRHKHAKYFCQVHEDGKPVTKKKARRKQASTILLRQNYRTQVIQAVNNKKCGWPPY